VPNFDIPLFIVAPESRRGRVFDEITRPIFSRALKKPHGRAVQGLEIDLVHQQPALDLRQFSTEDLEAMLAIFQKYEPSVPEMAVAGEIPFRASSSSVGRSRQR